MPRYQEINAFCRESAADRKNTKLTEVADEFHSQLSHQTSHLSSYSPVLKTFFPNLLAVFVQP